jgi:hypothetical protein
MSQRILRSIENISPATVVRGLGAVLAKYAASQPDPQKATETFIGYFRDVVGRIVEDEARQKKKSDF